MTKRLVAYIALGLLFAMFCGAMVLGGLSFFPRSGTDAMKSVTVELSSDRGHGSGVVISRNFILTVAHVSSEAKTTPLDVLFADGSHGLAVQFWQDPSRDVAVMILLKATKITPARLSGAALVDVQEIWSAGYPLDLPLSIQRGAIASPQVSNVKMDHGTENGAAVYTNLTMAPGDSGGPVFNASGEVVGLNDFTTQFASFSGIVAMQAVLADIQSVTGL